jgi:hypothetical protein
MWTLELLVPTLFVVRLVLPIVLLVALGTWLARRRPAPGGAYGVAH